MLFRFGGICERPIDGEARWLERCTTYRTLQFNVCRRCWRTKYRASVSCGDACDRPKIPVGSGVSAHALLTEKFGEVRIPRKSGLDPAPVTGGPQNILQEGDSGLLDVVLDPAFETNQTVFITFNEGTKEQNHLAVFRAKFDGAKMSGGKVIFRSSPEKAGPQHSGGRMVFLPDGTFLVTVSDGFTYRDAAQDLGSDLGKVLRLDRDGQVPRDNPFVGKDGV